MLTPEDIKLIGEELGNVIEQNITPQFEEIRRELQVMGRRVDRVDGKVNLLVNVLQKKRVISTSDKDRVLV